MVSDEKEVLGDSGKFKSIPTFSPEQIQDCHQNRDFMPLAFDLYRAVSVELITLMSVHEDHPENERLRDNLDFQIIQGMFIRVVQLMLSVAKLAAEQKHKESIFILKRCIDETLINIIYLIRKSDPQLFANYRKYSLIPEAELWDLIGRNVEARGGTELPIEISMKDSIGRACKTAKIDLNDVPRKHASWGGSTKEKCKALGMIDYYNAVMMIPSHAVHGSFVDLIQHYLQNENGRLVPKDCINYPDDALLVTSGLLCSLAAQAYCETFFIHEDVRAALLQHFKDFGKSFHDMNAWSIKARHGKESAVPG